MYFSENMTKVVSDQLTRFLSLNRHQLAGQVANLDFWLDQVRNALEVIDGYEQRFRRLKSAQDEYVAEHQTQEFMLWDPQLQGKPEPPRRVGSANLREARRSLTDATYRFLVRCCNDGTISEERLRTVCRSLEIGVETRDLHGGRT